MAWMASILTLLYYLSLPFTFIFSVLLLPLKPFLHLFGYLFHAIVTSCEHLAKFEGLYIYFTTAALIGLLSGAALHYISNFLHSLIDLQNDPKITADTTTTNKKSIDYDVNEDLTTKIRNLPPTKHDVNKAYHEYWEQSHSASASERRKSGMGNTLAREVILEEEDSDDVF